MQQLSGTFTSLQSQTLNSSLHRHVTSRPALNALSSCTRRVQHQHQFLTGLRQPDHTLRLTPCQASIDEPEMAPLVKQMNDEVGMCRALMHLNHRLNVREE